MKLRFVFLPVLLFFTLPLSAQSQENGFEHGPAPEFPLDEREIDRAGGPVHSYAATLGEVTPAVVGIFPSRIVNVRERGMRNPLEEMLRRYYGLPAPDEENAPGASREQRIPYGMGSGVIVSPDGFILTNNHVVTDERGNRADEILVRLSDDREYEAVIVGNDPKTDVAVIKITPPDGVKLPHARLANSEDLLVGDVVFAVGNPLGVGLTVTMGIVSATGRSDLRILGQQAYENFIQTDASINPGNSGGALVDTLGRVVGINTAIISRSGGNIGIGFAIPSNLARTIMVSLIETGAVQRGLLGVRISDLTTEMAEAFGVDSTDGALVEQVEDGLPADRAGLRRGDIIVELDGRGVPSSAALRLAISQTAPGTTVSLTILRDGEERALDVVLGDLNDPYGATAQGTTGILEGVSLKPLDDELREEYSIEEEVEGVLVSEIGGDSPYWRSLRPGMVLLEVNDKAVRTPSDVQGALQSGVNRLYVYDGGNRGFVALRLR